MSGNGGWNGGYAGGGGQYGNTSTGFGGYGGSAAGGFVSGSQGGGDSPSQKTFRNGTLVPVTVRMLVSAKPLSADAPLMLANHELSNVRIMGRITRSQVTSQLVRYTVTDGAHSVECTKFGAGDGTDAADAPAFAEGTYVKVFGLAKFNTKNATVIINTNHVAPVSGMDEVTFHNLECVYVHLQMTRGTDVLQNPAMNPTQSNAFHNSAYSAGATPGGGFNQNSAGNTKYAGLPRVEASILQLLDAQDALYQDAIQQSLRGIASAQEIELSLSFPYSRRFMPSD
ncbi:hypothetical protein BC830DRAFT_1173974 [Chytriomyces sp. MP71]|nr:hypothetical protein BC830DRAFT_1173974 [Chytriomyces sp. MP71]